MTPFILYFSVSVCVVFVAAITYILMKLFAKTLMRKFKVSDFLLHFVFSLVLITVFFAVLDFVLSI